MASVLVLGATGRYSPLARVLLDAGHRVLAGTRRPHSPAARALRAAGAEPVAVDFDDPGTIRAAAELADVVFAAGTAHRAGPSGDSRHGQAIVGAAQAAGAHLVYVSVAGADRPSDVPIFEGKRRVEDAIRASGAPFTIVAPVYFMENVWNPWNLAVLAGGRLPSPVPASRLLQQISLDTVIDVVSHVIRSRHSLAGERIEIASDELSSLDAAEVVSRIVGRRVDVDDELRGGPLPLFAWLDRVGYSVDLDSLRRRFSDVRWRRFEDWAAEQDWSILAGTPS
ncbi:MAG TPA: NmrA family NAD(P)-binding protein [Gaiellaceae bacterium]|nr:NmrA family NAD(P)-binding protein [Gaiellaceae bacterium]